MKIRNLKLAAFVAALVATLSCALAQDSLGLPPSPESGATAPKAVEAEKPATGPSTPAPAAEAKEKAKLEKKLGYAKKIRDFPNCPKEDWDWAVAQIKSIESQIRIIEARADVADRKIHRLNSVVFDKRRGVKALDRAVFDKKTGLEARVKALEDKLNPPAESKDQPAAKDDPSSKETKQPDAKEADKPAEKADQPAKQDTPKEPPKQDATQANGSRKMPVLGLPEQATQPEAWWRNPSFWGWLSLTTGALAIVGLALNSKFGWWKWIKKRLGW